MVLRSLFTTLLILVTLASSYAQYRKKSDNSSRKSEAQIRREVQQQMQDSIRNAESSTRPKLTNNEGIEREELQINLDVDETMVESSQMKYGDKNYPAVTVDIPSVDQEVIQKEWTKILEGDTKSKMSEGMDGLYIAGAMLETVSTQSLNVYSRVTKTEYGVRLVAAFEEPEGEFINSNKNKLNSAKAMLKEFGREQYTSSLKSHHKEENSILEDMEKDLKKLQKENEKMHKVINENELKIVNTKNDEKANLLEQDRLIEEISSKKTQISRLAKDARKDAEKELKSLEKDKKKLQKDVENMNKDIVSYRADIEETQRLIQRNLSEQDLQKARISRQLNYVKSLEGKIATLE